MHYCCCVIPPRLPERDHIHLFEQLSKKRFHRLT
jgi:hypothetical protein